jgi:hypothetical protein
MLCNVRLIRNARLIVWRAGPSFPRHRAPSTASHRPSERSITE